MAHETETQTLLGHEISKRLLALRLSRRQFVKQTGLSRQTLHNVERGGLVDLWPTTFDALDRGLEWPPGTAQALAQGNRESIADVMTNDERLSMIRKTLIERIATMTLGELEQLTAEMERVAFGEAATDISHHLEMMENRLAEIKRRMALPGNSTTHETSGT